MPNAGVVDQISSGLRNREPRRRVVDGIGAAHVARVANTRTFSSQVPRTLGQRTLVAAADDEVASFVRQRAAWRDQCAVAPLMRARRREHKTARRFVGISTFSISTTTHRAFLRWRIRTKIPFAFPLIAEAAQHRRRHRRECCFSTPRIIMHSCRASITTRDALRLDRVLDRLGNLRGQALLICRRREKLR